MMGKNQVKVIVEKEKTKRMLTVERIIRFVLPSVAVILLLVLLMLSLFLSDWR